MLVGVAGPACGQAAGGGAVDADAAGGAGRAQRRGRAGEGGGGRGAFRVGCAMAVEDSTMLFLCNLKCVLLSVCVYGGGCRRTPASSSRTGWAPSSERCSGTLPTGGTTGEPPLPPLISSPFPVNRLLTLPHQSTCCCGCDLQESGAPQRSQVNRGGGELRNQIHERQRRAAIPEGHRCVAAPIALILCLALLPALARIDRALLSALLLQLARCSSACKRRGCGAAR